MAFPKDVRRFFRSIGLSLREYTMLPKTHSVSSTSTATRVHFSGMRETGGRGVVSENLDGGVHWGSLGGVAAWDLDLDESVDEGDTERGFEYERYGHGEEFRSFVCGRAK